MTEHAEAPPETVAELRSVCLGLPAAYEEAAWVGTRWRIRKQTFAHVLMVDYCVLAPKTLVELVDRPTA